MSNKIDCTNLVQVVIVRSDLNMSATQVGSEVARASIGLITRCFESSKRFLGKYERNAYQEVIMSWIDNYDQDCIVVEVDSAEDLDAYLFTAEFSDIPTNLAKDNKGRISSDNPITALAVGPYNRDVIFEAIGELIPQEIMDNYNA